MAGVLTSKHCRFVLSTVLAVGLTAVTNDSAQASGGSWGGSRGGFSSGGSWGGSGGLLARRPVRSLLARIGSRVAGSGGSLGSRGGSFGGSFGGSTGRWSGSTGGWSGSTGGWSGSTGGWSGSTGGWSGSTGGWSGSTGDLGAFASSSYSGNGGSWGSSNLNSYASVSSTPIVASYAAPSYVDDFSLGSPITSDGYSLESSYPVGDYGLESGFPIQNITPASNFEFAPTETQILDGGPIDSMLPGAIPLEGGFLNGSGLTDESFNPSPNFGNENVIPSIQSQPGVDQVDPPGPVDDSTSVRPLDSKASVLNLLLPEEAKVYINSKLTKTEGSRRSYISRKLTGNKEYKYQVKAVMVKNGKTLVRTKLVKMRAGADQTVEFDFNEPVMTTLALKVPPTAKVTLCGKTTSAKGINRTFATQSLKDGNVWKGYQIEVEFEQDGKTLVEQRTLDLAAGETYTLAIGVTDEAMGDEDSGVSKVASR